MTYIKKVRTDKGDIQIDYTGLANLPSGSNVGSSIEGLYYADVHGVTPGNADNASALQALIDKVWKDGGGCIILGTGVYKVSEEINLRSKVSLQGQGVGATVLKANPALRDKAYSATGKVGVIKIPEYGTHFRISDLTITCTVDKFTDNKKGVQYTPAGYYAVQGLIGIYAEEITNDGTDNAPYHNINGDRYQNIYALIAEGYTPVESDHITYKQCTIEDVVISFMPSYGLCIYSPDYRKASYVYTLNNLAFEHNGCGALVSTSDLFINDWLVERNAYDGCIIISSNSKIHNIKSIWNGCMTTVGSRVSPFLNSIGQTLNQTYAVYFFASRSSITNIESQDNGCSGIMVRGDDISASGIISDSNGYQLEYFPYGGTSHAQIPKITNDSDKDCVGIYIHEGHRCTVQCKTYDYNSARGRNLKHSLYLGTVSDSRIDWSCAATDNNYDYANYVMGISTDSAAATPKDSYLGLGKGNSAYLKRTNINGVAVS